jgi:hypothetical protein
VDELAVLRDKIKDEISAPSVERLLLNKKAALIVEQTEDSEAIMEILEDDLSSFFMGMSVTIAKKQPETILRTLKHKLNFEGREVTLKVRIVV